MDKKIKKLTQGAIMIAMATVLSFIVLYKMPNGGSVTLASMVPIILFSYLHNAKWSVFVAFTYSLIQMLLGFYPPPTGDLLSFVLVIFLDYVIAFGVLGLAGSIGRIFKNKLSGFVAGSMCVVAIRFVCHFLSGILIWKAYAPEGQSPALYSIIYNGPYMAMEFLITVFVVTLLYKALPLKRLATEGSPYVEI